MGSLRTLDLMRKRSGSVCFDLETFSFAGRLKVVVDQLKLGVGCREVMLPSGFR